jgi:hypothetical protein
VCRDPEVVASYHFVFLEAELFREPNRLAVAVLEDF